MPTATELETLYIRCDGSLFLNKIPLISTGSGGTSKDDYNDFEKELKEIPNVKLLNSPKTFSWAHRTLFGLVDSDANKPWKGDYMMYVCLDERSGLPHNEYLERLVELCQGPKYPMRPFKVYGDAIVFRTESTTSQADMETRYVDMDEAFLRSAISEKLEDGTWAWIIVRKLLVRPQKRG